MTEPREKLLRQQYLSKRYPDAHVIIDAALGMPPEPLVIDIGLDRALRLSRPSRPKIDALIIEPARLLLIEFKILRWLDGISKLPAYSAMVDFTPELKEYQARGRTMRVVLPAVHDNILMTAYALGVEVEEFTSPEIDHYVKVEDPATRQSAARIAREDKRRARELLGLE